MLAAERIASCFAVALRIPGSLKTRAKIRPGCSTTWKRRARFSGNSWPSGAKEIPGLDVATAYVPARELGGDFTTCCPMVWAAWPSPTVTFREKASEPRGALWVPGHWYPA